MHVFFFFDHLSYLCVCICVYLVRVHVRSAQGSLFNSSLTWGTTCDLFLFFISFRWSRWKIIYIFVCKKNWNESSSFRTSALNFEVAWLAAILRQFFVVSRDEFYNTKWLSSAPIFPRVSSNDWIDNKIDFLEISLNIY